ncbi:TonB-dependent receptor [Candidatus Koribacter versatilis Ellin345]|uniref:TonB-dependent receptor n=1 Tax=Koribacter versatilis (strain Ellin345) TaxID=204669 RepID=Q1IUM8_KORVE|nr:TonB-dependent receptor [Candidatus Koribacter versatilis]ABF39422.1 TonB-dependent receptor [Candidatus Koribacter versatilis Ellin345]
MNSCSRVVALLLLCFAVVGFAFGQADTGQVTGVATDPSGAIVAGAKVTITDVNTGATRTSTTTQSGTFAFTNLKPSAYDVVVEAEKFARFTRRLDVSVGSRNDLQAQLAVTSAGTTVDVTAETEAAQVNTESQTLSNVVTAKQIAELPTLTRNAYDLVATAGNVVEDTTDFVRGTGFSINGQRSASTDILLDGGENVDLYDAAVGQNVPLDSVQEFRIVTSDFTAEYGRAGGGVVNVATKSGTNAFHGTAYDFNRVSALAANSWENDANGIDKGHFTRNQFGYSIGGPVVKNKLFFFSSTEWTRVRSTNNNIATIIDPAFLAAPEVSDNTKAFFQAYGARKDNLDVLDVQTWAQTPHTTSTGPADSTPTLDKVSYQIAGNSGGGAPQNSYSTVNRVDWNATDKTTIFGRYALESQDYFPGYISFSPYSGYDTPDLLFRNNVLINMTHVFSPNFVSQSKIAYNRLNESQPFSTAPVGPTLYSNYFGLPTINGGLLLFPGYSPSTPGNSIPYGGPQNLYQLYQDLSWTKGKHQLRFGGQYIHTRDNRTFGAYEGAAAYLNNAFDVGDAFDQLVAGNTKRYQVAVDPQGKFPCPYTTDGAYQELDSCKVSLPVSSPSFTRHNHYNDGAWYAQDTWKFTPRLTLNLGLRWEYYGVQHNVDTSPESNFYLGQGSGILEQIRNGSVQLAGQGPTSGLWAPDRNNFAPRVGFAWDVFGDGKTAIRGGYGISYERNFGNVTFNVIQNPPGQYVMIQAAPISVDNFGPLAPGSGANPYLRPGSLRAVNQNIPTAYTESWSFAVERQVIKNSVLAFEYSGAHGVHLYDIANISGAGMGYAFFGDPDSVRLTGTNLQYSAINYRSANGFNTYGGLNTRFTTDNLFNLGLQLNFNWTWSHSLDNLSNTFSEAGNGPFQLGYVHPFDPVLDKGNSEYDARHRFVVSAVWQVPWGKKVNNSVLRQVVDGWSLSPLFSYHTGYSYSIFDGTNAFNNDGRWIPGAATSRDGSANRNSYVGGGVFNYMGLPWDPNNMTLVNLGQTTAPGAVAGTGVSWGDLPINPATGLSSCPTVGSLVGCSYGPNTDRNQFVGPGNHQFNAVIGKTFRLSERFSMQFRGEFYNVFNNHNYYLLTTNADVFGMSVAANGDSSLSAGRNIQAVKGGYGNALDETRNIQLGLKLIF